MKKIYDKPTVKVVPLRRSNLLVNASVESWGSTTEKSWDGDEPTP